MIALVFSHQNLQQTILFCCLSCRKYICLVVFCPQHLSFHPSINGYLIYCLELFILSVISLIVLEMNNNLFEIKKIWGKFLINIIGYAVKVISTALPDTYSYKILAQLRMTFDQRICL